MGHIVVAETILTASNTAYNFRVHSRSLPTSIRYLWTFATSSNLSTCRCPRHRMESPLTGRNAFRFQSNSRRKCSIWSAKGYSVRATVCGYLVSLDETKYDLERLGSFLENREMEEPWSTSEMACGYREIAYSIGTWNSFLPISRSCFIRGSIDIYSWLVNLSTIPLKRFKTIENIHTSYIHIYIYLRW